MEKDLELEAQMNEPRNWRIKCDFALDADGESYVRDFRGTEAAVQEAIGRMTCPGNHTYEEV